MVWDRDKEILDALMNDHSFGFKDKGKVLNQGKCPNCGRKSVWVPKDKPGRVQCDHETSCKPFHYSVTTKELYPELFENYAEKHPATEEDPKATARVYLNDRGFNSAIIAEWYEQGYFPLKGGEVAPTVRINLWDGFYWERIIDKKHVAQAGRKNSYKKGIQYSGKHWEPKGFMLEDDDECIITEGIFNAWVFLHQDRKAVASLSSGNFPAQLVESNRRRGITWILAYDNDTAGLKHMREYIEHLDKMGEQWKVMLTRNSKQDWNDEFQADRIDDKYLNDALWRGCVSMAKSAREKAFWLWARSSQSRIKVEHYHALYSFKADEKASKEVSEVLGIDGTGLDFLWINNDYQEVKDAQAAFNGKLSGGRISNCVPRFLYIERDPLTEEQDYFFDVTFRNGNPKRLIALDGSSLESASSLNKALLGKTSGGTFDGDANDIKNLKEEWFDHRTTEITRLRFVGYDKASKTWVYPEFGFHGGRFIEQNDMGYLSAGQNKVKTKVASNQVKMIHREQHDEGWINLYEKTFGHIGLIVMAWWLCTLFAEHIREKYQDWPFLELTGEPGTGKTTLLKFLWRCVGRIDGYEGFDPAKSSVAGRSRTLERYSALPTVVIEADRADKPGAKKSFDFNEFKDFFNGGIIRTTGVKNGGNETVEPPYRGGVLIAQNASVDSDDDAVMERIVHCHSTKAHHTHNSKEYARHMASMKTEDVCGWLHKALTSEKQFLETFDQQLTTILDNYHQRKEVVRERIIENHAKIAAGVWCLQILFPRHMTTEKCKSLQDALWTMAVERERRIKADSPLVEMFWEYYEDLNVMEYEDHESREFVTAERLNHSRTEDVIAINLVEFEKMASKHGLRIPMADLKKQLPNCHSRPFMERKNVNSQITGKSKSCWVFRREAGK
ncbi:toprim domain-containing protein [Endozoicomonas sp. GU-1]|uniref:toprim domain-containing protein n=1 Tax=Endozoicomonas sp. GU-1 TaxID=3009078 RepID=UPI0022B3CAE6|nr:toprim domain-containing protein [Endozoicomonas sp. GU-1]WBA86494.1 toprim domain-containing protein [Endozoicomonas sp. GU-1]